MLSAPDSTMILTNMLKFSGAKKCIDVGKTNLAHVTEYKCYMHAPAYTCTHLHTPAHTSTHLNISAHARPAHTCNGILYKWSKI